MSKHLPLTTPFFFSKMNNQQQLQWEQATWQDFTQGRLKQISHRDGGTPFKKGIVLRGVEQAKPKNNAKAEEILIHTIFGVNSDNRLYEWRVNGWYQFPDYYIYVCCSRNDNSVWGINANNRLVKIINRHGVFVGKIMSPEMHVICVAPLKNGHIAIIDKDHNIYIGSGNYWKKLDGQAVFISVGVDGTTWVINHKGEIYRRDSNKWTHIEGKAVGISVLNSENVICWNQNDEVYRWRGNKWEQMNGKVTSLSLGFDEVYANNRQNMIYVLSPIKYTPKMLGLE